MIDVQIIILSFVILFFIANVFGGLWLRRIFRLQNMRYEQALAEIKETIRCGISATEVEIKREMAREQLLQDMSLALNYRIDTTSWSLDFNALLSVRRAIIEKGPCNILDLGSGLSTIICAAMLERAGGGMVYSVDHNEEFLQKTMSVVSANGLGSYVSFVPAHLRKLSLPDWPQVQKWYSITALERLPELDIVIIDGPPKDSAPYARMAALPTLWPKITNGCILILDDFGREQEQHIYEQWLKEFDISEDLRLGGSKSHVVFRANKHKAATSIAQSLI